MYFSCPFKEEILVAYLRRSDESKALIDAYAHFGNDEFTKAHDILDGLISDGCALAMVLSCIFSKEDEEECDFYVRHIECLVRASKLKNPLALYSLGVYYDRGELLELDKSKACDYFRESANLGMPQAEHIYGVMLYYGTGGAQQDQAKGLRLVKSAAQGGIAEALEFLEYIDPSTLENENAPRN